MNFAESLAGLMLEKEISSQALADSLGVTQQTVNNWKAGRSDLGLSYLVKLCLFFNCSLEYLTGKTDTCVRPSKYEIENFGRRLRKVMKSKGVSSYKLQKDTRYHGKYFSLWDKGSDPKLSTLVELANYFKCSLDELVGLE